jgi:hypothetical protein
MLPLDVASLVEDFDLTPQLGPLVIERRAAPTVDALGEVVPGALTLVRATPWTAHTSTGRNLQQLPEADRTTETIEVYARVRFYVADGDRAPDVVRYKGARYRVAVVNDFSAQGRTYFAMAVKIEQGAS